MSIILILLLCLFLFLPSSVAIHAQDNALDPATLFEENVEIVATETITNAITPYADWDDDRREITVFLDDRVTHYPYPDEVLSFSRQSSAIWRDYVVLNGYMEREFGFFVPLILNLQTGTFVLYEPQCGANSPTEMDYDFRNALWVVEMTPTGVYLCATLTGERTAALNLPQDFEPLALASIAPDFAHVVFFSTAGDVYSYAFATEQITQIGTLAPDTTPRINGWIDQQDIVLNVRSDEQCAAYIADVTAADSLTLALETASNCATLRSNPARLVFNQSTPLNDESPLLTCTQTIYDIETGARQFYDYGTLCRPDFGTAEAVGYYRAVADDRRTVEVVRFNPATGELVSLYSLADIEWIDWVAEDERFAVLLLDDNGYINRLPGAPSSEWMIERPNLALIDLKADRILYQLEIPWDEELSSAVLSTITMLRDDLLFVGIRELDMILIPYTDSWMPSQRYISNQLVLLTDGEPLITQIDQVAGLQSDNARLLIWTDGHEISTALHGYDIASGEITPILRAVDQTQYSVSVASGDSADTAIVTVYSVLHGSVDRRSGTRYIIRF